VALLQLQWPRTLLIYLAAACVLTWPLVMNLAKQIPLGTESVATVPLFNLWTLRWSADRLRHGYAGYWDAPIFYPAEGALALSEPQPLTGFIFGLLDWLTAHPILAYNLTLLMILTLNGFAAAVLLRTLGIASTPAQLGGLFAVGLPFVFNELGVLQLTVVFPIFLAFAALKRFSDNPSFRSAASLGGAVTATFLTCSYYGLFLSVFLVWGGACFARRHHWRLAAISQIASGSLLAGLTLWPILTAQAQVTGNYARSQSTILANSATPKEYLQLDARAVGHGLPWLKAPGIGEQRLYPGSGLLALAALGLLVAWREGRRRWVLYCVVGAMLAMLLSLGANLNIAGVSPYQILARYVPGYAKVRSPFRFAVFVQVFLVGLAGFGLDQVWRPANWYARVVAIGLTTLGLLEVATPPANLYPFPFNQMHAPWIEWLAAQPSGAVAMVPFPVGSRARDYEATVLAMLQALAHHHPLVNGYSGFFPLDYLRLRWAMHDFPNARSLALLRTDGVRYLVVDRAWLTDKRLGQLATAALRRSYVDPTVVVYELSEAAPH
jgi:hypothetical protein